MATSNKEACLFCQRSGHTITTCYKFLALSVAEKRHFIITLKLCNNSLKANHCIETCQFINSRKCEQRHHTLIHEYLHLSESNFHTDECQAIQSPQSFYIHSVSTYKTNSNQQ